MIRNEKNITDLFIISNPDFEIMRLDGPHTPQPSFFNKQYNVIQKLEILGKNRHVLRLQCVGYTKSIREEVTVCVKVIVIKIEC